jgi:hypothetical protein
MAKKVNPVTSYVQTELPYLYCPTCGRKEYRLVRAGLTCNLTQPTGGHCPGVLTASTTVNVNIDSPDPHGNS